MIRRIRDSHSFTLNAHLCIHVSHVSSSYSVLKVPKAIKIAPPHSSVNRWSPGRSSRERPAGQLSTYFALKFYPNEGTKKAGPLPAPEGRPQFATTLYLVVITFIMLRKRLFLLPSQSLSPTMEMRRLELLTSAVQRRRSPN